MNCLDETRQRQINKTFNYGSVKLIITAGCDCLGCYFRCTERDESNAQAVCKIAGTCSRNWRKDKTNVVFKEMKDEQ